MGGEGDEVAALMRRTARLAGRMARAKGTGGDADEHMQSVM